jgi:Phage tail tube protein
MGVSSKIGTIAIAKQTAKGAAATTPTHKYQLAAAPTLYPTKTRERLESTDSGRDMGLSYTQRISVEGDFAVYLYPDGAGPLLYSTMGAVAHSGTTTFTHTITPANDLPWYTIWRMVGANIFEKFTDCKIGQVQIEGEAGGAPIATCTVVGVMAEFEVTDTVLAPVASRPYIYHEGCGRIKINDVAYQIASVSFGINNNVAGYQADCVTYADVSPGQREVTLTFRMRYENPTTEPKYRETYYGSDAGTLLTDQVALKAFEWQLFRDADFSFLVELPQVVYVAVPVTPDPGGDPIEVEVECQVEKPSPGVIATVTVMDQTATY